VREPVTRICPQEIKLANIIATGIVGGLVPALLILLAGIPWRSTIILGAYMGFAWSFSQILRIGSTSVLICQRRVWSRPASPRRIVFGPVLASGGILVSLPFAILSEISWLLVATLASIVVLSAWCSLAWSLIGRRGTECDNIELVKVRKRNRSAWVTLVGCDGVLVHLGPFERSLALPALLAELQKACGGDLRIVSEEQGMGEDTKTEENKDVNRF
jgi:hypothetical protein